MKRQWLASCRDIGDSRGGSCCIRTRFCSLARRSNFGPGRLSRASWRSQRTNPHLKRQWLYRDIRESRGHTFWPEQHALILQLQSTCRHIFFKIFSGALMTLDDLDIHFSQIFRQAALMVSGVLVWIGFAETGKYCKVDT